MLKHSESSLHQPSGQRKWLMKPVSTEWQEHKPKLGNTSEQLPQNSWANVKQRQLRQYSSAGNLLIFTYGQYSGITALKEYFKVSSSGQRNSVYPTKTDIGSYQRPFLLHTSASSSLKETSSDSYKAGNQTHTVAQVGQGCHQSLGWCWNTWAAKQPICCIFQITTQLKANMQCKNKPYQGNRISFNDRRAMQTGKHQLEAI